MTTRSLPGQDWTESERAEIRRLEKVCDASEHWTLECSQTDIGDPWCIVYDREYRRIILHIARIERQYVVVWPREQRSAKDGHHRFGHRDGSRRAEITEATRLRSEADLAALKAQAAR
jgi:hypothetical protein